MQRDPTSARTKFWCFTINNPAANYKDVDGVVNWDYMVIGNEICPDTGTPHLQGFVAYKVRTKFNTVKRQMPRAHIEPMAPKSTPQKAANYCKKDGNYDEIGQLPDWKGGASGGLKKAENFKKTIEAAKRGDLEEIEELNPVAYVQHYHAYKRIMQDNPQKPKDLEEVCGEWLWGEPGVGKSYRAREENPDHYDKPLNKWWDGYRGQEAIILDDVGMQQANWIGDLLKRWADRYSFPAEQKGTTIQIRPQKIIVTSNYKIEEIFQDATLCKAIQRRFKEIEVKSWKEWTVVQIESEDEEDQ